MDKTQPPSKPGTPAVLADHIRQGKSFIPPMCSLGRLHEVGWVDRGIPETLWIALLNHTFGVSRAATLALQLAKASQTVAASRLPLPAFASAYTHLSDDERYSVLESLRSLAALDHLSAALGPLVTLYPVCPLSFLVSSPSPLPASHLPTLKLVLASLFDRSLDESMFVQGTCIYLAFELGRLKVVPGVALANLNALSAYPHTEEARRVGASVRAAFNAFLGTELKRVGEEWPTYFWNRGLVLEPCCHE